MKLSFFSRMTCTILEKKTLLALFFCSLAGQISAQTASDETSISLPTDATPPVPALGADSREVVRGINLFAVDLYRRTLQPQENLFISPTSVSIAMGLAYRGARGKTADELRKVMHYELPPVEYLRASAALLPTLNFSAHERQLKTANAIWLQQGMPLLSDYEADMTRYGGAGLKRVDFMASPDAARTQINQWVADATNGKINDLLAPPEVSAETRTILVNAIYWKGSWQSPFEPETTKSQPFSLLDGGKIETPMMEQFGDFHVVARDGIKAILLPYEGGEVDMAVLLPNSARGLPALERSLTADALDLWLTRLDAAAPRRTILTLPKMHLKWRGNLAPRLAAMGAPLPFSDQADFLGMATPDYPGELAMADGFKISNIIHKTFLDVDESGSEAAAATAVVMDVIVSGSRGPPPPPPFIFRADKPYLFVLRDRRTKLILFIGRFVQPASK